MKTRIVVLLGSLLAWIPRASAADTWVAVQSKNFLLVGNAGQSQIRLAARQLERFREGFAMLFPAVRDQSTVSTTVLVFKDDASFRPFKPLYRGKPLNIDGYFQPGSDVNFIALVGDSQTPRVVYHELVHSLTEDATRPLPLWASEGLADFYSSFEVVSGGRALELGRAIPNHVSALRQGPPIPMATLLAVDHNSPYYNESTKQGMFYAQSWALVHYLMAGNNGERRAQLSKYAALVGSGTSIDDSLREAFHTDSRGLERELADYVRNRAVWPGYTVKLEEKLDFDEETQTSMLSEAETRFYLGDLLLHMSRYDVAEKQLQMAIALDPNLTGPQTSMGLMRLQQDRDDDALQFLSKAARSDSESYLAHFYYASLLEQLAADDEEARDRQERLELMRTHLKKSIAIAPRFVEAYNLLGYVALELRDELAYTETMLSKALDIAPGRETLRLTLGEVMAANNEAEAARTLLDELRVRTSDSIVRSRAENLLERLAAPLESAQADTFAPPSVLADQPPPTEPRAEVPPARSGADAAFRRTRRVEGPQIEGLLIALDCARGLTLDLRVGQGVVRLHTETPSNINFVRYVSTVSDSIACGPVKPEPSVVITYRRAADPAFLGEPLVVEFR